MKRRHQWGPSGWGRRTWGCGGKGPAWWAGWWAGCPAPWSGTCPGIGRKTCPVALARWGAPGGGTRTRRSGSPSSCSSPVCWGWRIEGNVRSFDHPRVSNLLSEKKNFLLNFFYHLVLPKQAKHPQCSIWFLLMKTRANAFFSFLFD